MYICIHESLCICISTSSRPMEIQGTSQTVLVLNSTTFSSLFFSVLGLGLGLERL